MSMKSASSSTGPGPVAALPMVEHRAIPGWFGPDGQWWQIWELADGEDGWWQWVGWAFQPRHQPPFQQPDPPIKRRRLE